MIDLSMQLEVANIIKKKKKKTTQKSGYCLYSFCNIRTANSLLLYNIILLRRELRGISAVGLKKY
jgi:hypothetical protein